jgi:hypothetical protein
MRGLTTIRSARTISAGHAFVQNLSRSHCAITADLTAHDRVRVPFDELALCPSDGSRVPPSSFDVHQGSTQHRRVALGTAARRSEAS